MRKTSVAAGAVLLFALTFQAAPAFAAPVITPSCGATITSNAVLGSDLTCTSGDGLKLGPGVTLDLAGHRLAGSTSGIGVQMAAAGTSAVKNGTVSGWAQGIAPNASAETTTASFDRLTLTGNDVGLSGLNATYTIKSSSITGNATGIGGSFTFVTVTRSRVTGNTTAGIAINTGGNIAVASSTLSGNTTAVSCSEVPLSVASSVFTDNTVGIDVYYCGGTSVTGNTFRGNDRAYQASWEPSDEVDQLTGNRFYSNPVAVVTGVSSNLERNTFTGNGVGFKAKPGFLPQTVSLDSNVFSYNRDGVYVQGPSTLADNSAIKNSRYGIYAPQATDLGGNRAFGNGYQPQCTGLTCATS